MKNKKNAFSCIGHLSNTIFFDPCESLCQQISIGIKYNDIAQNLTIQWAIMLDTVNFPEPGIKRTNFTSNR